MKLKRTYDKQEDIPEGYAALFEEKDGKFVFAGLDGLKSDEDVGRVQQALDKERKDHRETKQKLAKFGDIDPEKIHEQLDELEELKTGVDKDKPDDQKIESIVEARVKRRIGPIERERDQLKAQVGELTTSNEGLNGQIRSSKIGGSLRDAAGKLKVVPSAMDDIVLAGERVFMVDETGKVVTKDGVDGLTPGVPAEQWLKDQQKARPHWWPSSQGGGAGGGGGGAGETSNPWHAKSWSLTEQGKVLREKGREQADNLAKSVGSFVGATRPPEQKTAA